MAWRRRSIRGVRARGRPGRRRRGGWARTRVPGRPGTRPGGDGSDAVVRQDAERVRRSGASIRPWRWSSATRGVSSACVRLARSSTAPALSGVSTQPSASMAATSRSTGAAVAAAPTGRGRRVGDAAGGERGRAWRGRTAVGRSCAVPCRGMVTARSRGARAPRCGIGFIRRARIVQNFGDAPGEQRRASAGRVGPRRPSGEDRVA